MNTKHSFNGKFLVPLIILIFVLSGASVYGLFANDSENTFMSVNKTANVSTAEVNDSIEYQIVIKNEGNETLNNVTVEDTLPYGVRYVNGSRSIVCTGSAVGAPIGAGIGARIGVKIGVKIGAHISVKLDPKNGANINATSHEIIGAIIGAKIGPRIGSYPETRYEVYLKPALLDKNLTEIYQTLALWDEKIVEIYQDSALWDEKIVEIYQTPALWNESRVTLFDIYGDLMYTEYLPLYAINNMRPQEVCTITYRAEVFLCHSNATNYANVTIKNSNNESIINEISSAVVDIPCPLPDFTVTNMSMPVIKEIKNVTIPYGTNQRNETLVFSALVFLNKTQIGDERKIYFDIENLEYLPYINFDALNVTLYDNDNYYDSVMKNFTNVVKISNISFNWTPATPGWHNLTIAIDPNNEIQESNKSNNNMTLEVLVVLPDLTVTNMSMPVIKEIKNVTIPYGTNIRNETLISSELVIANKTQIGQNRIIYFDIKNLEEPPFPCLGNVTIALYDNGSYYTSITKNLTNAYEYHNLSMNWTPTTPGLHNLTIVIDPDNEIRESNKSNNNMTLEILVVLPDLTVTNMSMPVIETIKKVTIPYGTDQRNEISNTSGLVIANRTPLGENRIIYFDIKNLEEPPFPYLSNVTMAMYDNGEYYTSITKNLVNAHKYYNLSMEWAPTTPGWHNLTIVIDPNNEIQESDKSNNNMTLEIEVILPDLTVSNMSMPIIKEIIKIIVPYNYSSIISSEFISARNTTINQERIIYADIKNLAEMQFSYLGNVSVALYDNNNYYALMLLNLSNAFEFFNLDFNWTPTYLGTHDLTCVADVNNEISESNEENNNMSIAIDALPVPTPDFTIINVSAIKISGNRLISEPLLIGENINIYIDIENLAEPPYLDIGDVNISLLIFDSDNNLVYNDTKTRNLTNVWKILNLNFSWTPLNEGTYTISAIIDSGSRINETNEFNNNFTIGTYINFNDTNGIRYLNIGTEKDYFMHLNAGWNLISIPVKPNDKSISAVLTSIEGKYTKVFAYENGWRYKVWFDGQEFGDLSTIEAGRGYWVYMKEPANLTVAGSEILSTEISLNEGWNLIGYASAQTTISGALSSIDGRYDKVFTYDAESGWSYISFYDGSWYGSLTNMVPGKGYWIHTTNDSGTLIIT